MSKSHKLTWNGETATLRASNAFRLADAIEEHVTFGELSVMRIDPTKIRFGKLAAAYSALLAEVGIAASIEEVHVEFTSSVRGGDKGEKLTLTFESIDWLIAIVGRGLWATSGEGDATEDKDTKNDPRLDL